MVSELKQMFKNLLADVFSAQTSESTVGVTRQPRTQINTSLQRR